MPKDCDVIIYFREVKLDVTIPRTFVYEFMEEFGREFAEDSLEGRPKTIKPVDSYYEHPNNWHIQVIIWSNHENKFYEFLAKFCKKRLMSFRKPVEKLGGYETYKV